MSIYVCVDCDLSYCGSCESGEDSCPKCSTGPRCLDCAYDHEDEHKEQKDDEED